MREATGKRKVLRAGQVGRGEQGTAQKPCAPAEGGAPQLH